MILKGRALSVGLLGQLLAILLVTVAIEFAASTFLYEQSSRSLIRDDEAHRLAEHLVIARKLLSDSRPAERPALAVRLTTNRYDVHWAGATAMPKAQGRERTEPYERVLDWEPSLADGDLRVELVQAGRHAQLFGALKLVDGSWMRFRASEPEDDADTGLDRIALALVPAAALLLLGALMFRRVLEPMKMLAEAAHRVGRSSGIVLPEQGPREVRDVIQAFNEMQARIRRLIDDRTQALAAVGHDMRTPLARLQLRADTIDDPDLRRTFAEDFREMEAMVESLLSYLGGEDDPERPVRMDVAVAAATIADDAADRGGDSSYVGPDHFEAMVRPVGFKRSIMNLVDNALHYGGAARVDVLTEGETLIVRVDDDGPGIPEERLQEVLQPFARLDPARARNTSGLGLGLAIVVRAMEADGGTLHLANRAEGGFRAEMRLPLWRAV